MIRGTVSLQRSAPSQSLASQLQRPLQDATYRFSSLLQATLPAPNRRPKIAGPLHLFAVASLTVFLAHPLRETLESELGVLDFRLSLPPSLLGAGLDLFFQHLRGLGAGLRVMAQFLGGANHESAKKTHLWVHSV